MPLGILGKLADFSLDGRVAARRLLWAGIIRSVLASMGRRTNRGGPGCADSDDEP